MAVSIPGTANKIVTLTNNSSHPMTVARHTIDEGDSIKLSIVEYNNANSVEDLGSVAGLAVTWDKTAYPTTAVFQLGATGDRPVGTEGDLFYDTTTHKLYVKTDAAWVVVGAQVA